MGFNCQCPLPAALGDISAFTCAENLGQIQKIVIQRRQAVAPFPTQDATVLGAAVLASWTTYKGAVDGTKVVTTPFFEGFVIPVSEAILEGGDDNTTVDGAPVVVGATTVRAEGMFRGLPAAILKELKALVCENDLTVYMINEDGKIIGTSASGTLFAGIPVTSFFIGDPGVEGLNTNDKASFGFSLRFGWRDNLALVVPTDFDARTEL